MFSKIWTRKSTPDCSQSEQLKKALHEADAVIIGAGAGLSTSAGFTYAGERFRTYFSDFASKYGFTDMYSGGFTSEDLPTFGLPMTARTGAGTFISTAIRTPRSLYTTRCSGWCRIRITL